MTRQSPNEWQEHFKFLPYGARIQEFKIGGHSIVLGYPNADDYKNPRVPFFGETIGRVANRLAGAQINELNGRSVKLAANNGPNSLHGGAAGWGKKNFEGPEQIERDGRTALQFKYNSPDGDEGYPGAVELSVWYYPEVRSGSSNQGEVVSLEIEYEARLVDGQVEETAINVTNHSYFNISGASTIEGTSVVLSTNLHQVTDAANIPTGEITAFPKITKGEAFTLGATEPDIDHCFIINDDPSSVVLDTRQQSMQKLVQLDHAKTGIRFEAFSTEPAFQFYTGRNINTPAIGEKPAMGPRSGLCIEASRYINAPNVDAWRPMVILRKGQVYGSRTIYRASLSAH